MERRTSKGERSQSCHNDMDRALIVHYVSQSKKRTIYEMIHHSFSFFICFFYRFFCMKKSSPAMATRPRLITQLGMPPNNSPGACASCP